MLDFATLLRDHVVPALVERGVVGPDEAPVVEPARRGGPAPGTFAVGTADVSGMSGAGDPDARTPEVHVHIERVTVTRAPAPPPLRRRRRRPPQDGCPRRLSRAPSGSAGEQLARHRGDHVVDPLRHRPVAPADPHWPGRRGAGRDPPAGRADRRAVHPRTRRSTSTAYLATPNHAWNPTDLPTRRANGSLVHRPVAALDLYYLSSCVGKEPELEGSVRGSV